MSIENFKNGGLAVSGSKYSIVNNDLSSGLAGSISVIKLAPRREKFEVVDGGEVICEVSDLECVIIAAGPLANKYYAGEYDPKAEARGPDCHSVNGITPDSTICDPQSQSCKNCPHKIWGSKGKGRACSDYRRLVVGIYDDGEYKVYRLDVPPASLRALAAYSKQLSIAKFAYFNVVTRISYEQNINFTRLEFTPVNKLDSKMCAMVEELRNSPQVVSILTDEVKNEEEINVVEDRDASVKQKSIKNKSPIFAKKEVESSDDVFVAQEGIIDDVSIFENKQAKPKKNDSDIFKGSSSKAKVTSVKEVTSKLTKMFDKSDEELNAELDEYI